MSKKIFVFLLVILTVINLTATITILYERWNKKPPFPAQGMPMEEPEVFLRDKLNLTPEQMEQLRQDRVSFWEDVGEEITQYKDMHRQMFELMTADQPDLTSIDSMIEAMSMLQTRIKHKTVRHILSDRNKLTPEQRGIMMQSFMDRMDRENQMPMFFDKSRMRDHKGRGFGKFRDDDSMPFRRYKNRTNDTLNNGGAQ